MTDQTLSDKIYENADGFGLHAVYVDDIKNAVRKLKDEINKFGTHKTGVHAGFLCLKIDEIFGDKLI